MTLARGALVIGASGLVGSALLRTLRRAGVSCAGTYAGHPTAGLGALDITRPEQVRECLDQVCPGAVFLAAALTHVDLCEEHRSEAFRINVEGPRIVAREASRLGARLIFYSSDYVFDGVAGPYDEEAQISPLSVYGQTKAEAERLVLALADDSLILRTAVVYGWHTASKNFAMQVFHKVRAGEIMTIPGDQWSNYLAEATLELVELGASGIVHVAGRDLMPRSEFARALVRVYGGDPERVVPVATQTLGQLARRPLRGGLCSDKYARLTGKGAISLEAALRRLSRQRSKDQGHG